MRYALLSFVGVFALVLATVAVAQTPTDQNTRSDQYTSSDKHDTDTISGTVVSSDANSLVLTTDDGRQMTFAVDTQSNMLPNLAAGQYVKVKYVDQGAGSYRVQEVKLDTSGKHGQSSSSYVTPSNGSTYNNNPTSGTTTGTTSDQYKNNNANTGTTTTDNNAYNNTTTTTTSTGMEHHRMRGNMPATASPLPFLGLLGLVAIGVAVSIRGFIR